MTKTTFYCRVQIEKGTKNRKFAQNEVIELTVMKGG